MTLLGLSSAMEKIPMTAAGYKALEDEINQLKNVDRHEIIKAIQLYS